MKIKVNEIFKSIQGEGNSQGVNSLFIRFLFCNLKCSICDSKYTWTDEDTKEIEIDEWIKKSNNIIFTGGEPLLPKNSKYILEIIKNYPKKNYEIETNGTIIPDSIYYRLENIQFNISPKNNVIQDNDNNIPPKIFLKLPKKYIVKILFDNENDFNYVKLLQELYKIPNDKIWLQPKAIDYKKIKKLTSKYFNYIIEQNWNISMRNHVILFGNKKGI